MSSMSHRLNAGARVPRFGYIAGAPGEKLAEPSSLSLISWQTVERINNKSKPFVPLFVVTLCSWQLQACHEGPILASSDTK
jgi:hypothetical protein